MKNYLKSALIILLVCIVTIGKSQSIAKKVANKKFADKSYAEAAKIYEDILDSKPDDQEVIVKLAECYKATNQNKKALALYSELVNQGDPDPGNVWKYAMLLVEEKDYKTADSWFKRYYKMVPTDDRGRKFSTAYEKVDGYFEDSVIYTVTYLHGLNSWQGDFSPFLLNKGLAFCSSRKQEVGIRKVYGYDQTPLVDWYFVPDTSALHDDIYAGLQSAQYTVDPENEKNAMYTAKNSVDSDIIATYGDTFLNDSIRYNVRAKADLVKLNHSFNKLHVGPACYSEKLGKLIFTANESGNSKIKRLKLYTAKVKEHSIVGEKELPFNSEDYSIGHPSMSPNGNRLYFTSDMPGGKGGTDIYYVDYNEGVWSEPVNMKAINTAGDESFPFVRGNGDLYFSSDGHPGLGGLDVFVVTVEEGEEISNFKNIGAPINSSNDDFGIVFLSSTHGYFSSNRKRGLTDDDLYHFEKQCHSVELTVYNEGKNNLLEQATVTVNDIETHVTDYKGKVRLCVDEGSNFFNISKKGFAPQNINSKESFISVMMTPLNFSVNGKILSNATGEALEGVKIELLNQTEGALVKEFTTTADNYKYNFELEAETEYLLTASKSGCGTNRIFISTVGFTKSQEFNQDLSILCTGDIVQVQNIYYEVNKAEITAQAAQELDKLAELMQKYPDMRIELRSHTDSRATAEFNMKLSALRAQAVVDYLTTKGIVPYRMRATGYGESQLLNNCGDGIECSEFEHQQNRRTEFKVLSIDERIADIDGDQNFHIGKSTNR
ncbi:OmpA family protein [Fulvivirga maritima]|uniref:OmpA family protein n=1 Tax=Fulvivirga maritima TaxID=2904247 RepID=UPI001F29A70E|nr:OmpA family protein [Fulvivirga maritima]UII26251.1 OmpA family protein [Fulvivirga maritima]